MEIKEIIKDLRKQRKLSAQQVADLCGISIGVYKAYESGQRNLGVPALQKLADFYNVSVDYLLGRDVPTPPTLPEILDRSNLDEFSKSFIFYYMQTSEKTRQELVDAIKKAAKADGMPESSDTDDLTESNIIVIPLHVGKVSAGEGFELPDDYSTEAEFYANEYTDKADFVLQIDGDSMLPVFMDGDYILVKNTKALDLGDIGVFAFRGKGYIKQYKGTYIHSLNPDYPDIHPTADSNIDILGKVLGTVEIRHK